MHKKGIAIVLVVVSVFFLFFIYGGYYSYLWGLLRPQPNFEISANPTSIILHSSKGSSNATVITVQSINGFNANLAFHVAEGFGIVGGIRFDLDFHQVYLPADGQAQIVLTLYVTSFVTPGEYYIDVIGVAGKLKHSVRITITVYY